MKKKFKVVMLPTEKAEGCIIKTSDNVLVYQKNPYLVDGEKLQHLYIISDDEIKCDWYIDNRVIDTPIVSNTPMHKDKIFACKKIVSTTDKGLVWKNSFVDGKQINKIVLSQIPESLIQAYIEAYNNGKPITEVDLEMMDIPIEHSNRTFGDKESLDPNGERSFYIGSAIKTRPDNTVIWSIVTETINN